MKKGSATGAKASAGPDAERSALRRLGLRVTDQETARVVAICGGADGRVFGTGCLLDAHFVLTCRHVVTAATGLDEPPAGTALRVRLIGVKEQPVVEATVERVDARPGWENDIALLRLRPPDTIALEVGPVEFASPLRHGGKRFATLGFPGGDPQGRHASGLLHAADALGLVQMDSAGALWVERGFSGAPVWSADLNAFVGLVVTELSDRRVAWCIPSRRLCEFHAALPVRFRLPVPDRPRINDREEDDPNVWLFGAVSDDGARRLTATVKEKSDHYVVDVTYECLSGAPRGRYVTFITYPDFEEDGEDAYELFSPVNDDGIAVNRFYPSELFTVAAIGDGGDTALTLNLSTVNR